MDTEDDNKDFKFYFRRALNLMASLSQLLLMIVVAPILLVIYFIHPITTDQKEEVIVPKESSQYPIHDH